MSGGFNTCYFKELARLEAGNFWFRSRNKLILWALRKYSPKLQSFLEIGCGTGFVISAISKQFPYATLSGSEHLEEGLLYARQRVPDARFTQMDARYIPYESVLDAIGAFDVLEHIEEDEAVLQQIFKALSPGGMVFITVPQHRWLWSAVDEYARHVRRYTAKELHQKVTKAGLEIIRSTSFVSTLLPAMYLSRLLKPTKMGGNVDTVVELRINTVLNKFFEWLLNFDLALIRAGIALPLGGSRLLVARKPFTLQRDDSSMNAISIPFNKPYMTGRELGYVAQAHVNGHLSGDGAFTKRCHAWLEDRTGSQKSLLTHSCTAALEMAAILADIQPGDEVIMPSYTFVSTANAFVLRGGVPVFVDIRPDTLNIDDTKIEAAITSRTKAIVPVHYAGVGCEMDVIMEIARRHDLLVIEDAAQGIMSAYKGKQLGAIGHLGTYSFHETKNVISGEGGALLVNDERFCERAEIIREKGTNRGQFFRGQVDKYTWVDVGSSYLPSEVNAAFLWGQLEEADTITNMRLNIWRHYHAAFAPMEELGLLRRPSIPMDCIHNAHMYYILVPEHVDRDKVIRQLKGNGIHAVFHYVPLHTSPAGKQLGRSHGTLVHTAALSERLIRLPMWVGIAQDQQDYIVDCLKEALVK